MLPQPLHSSSAKELDKQVQEGVIGHYSMQKKKNGDVYSGKKHVGYKVVAFCAGGVGQAVRLEGCCSCGIAGHRCPAESGEVQCQAATRRWAGSGGGRPWPIQRRRAPRQSSSPGMR